MSEITCIFCDTKFKNISNLNKHKKSAKFCLELQNKEIISVFKCEYCEKIFTRKDNLNEHVLTCKEGEKRKIDSYLKTIAQLEHKLENKNKKIDKLKIEIKELATLKVYKSLYEEERNRYIKLEEDYKQLTNKAIDKAGNNTITNNNTTNRNRIINSLLPLTDDFMREQSKFLTYNNVKDGAHGIAHFASSHTFKDRIYCSDVSRLSFVFKNEDENIIKDPEGVEITKKFIEINRDELLRLLDEYLRYVLNELDKDLDKITYEHWAERREETIAIRSAVKKGNMPENKESYNNFKKSFLSALSQLIAR